MVRLAPLTGYSQSGNHINSPESKVLRYANEKRAPPPLQAGRLIATSANVASGLTLQQITTDRENALALWKLRFAATVADEKLDACGIAVKECYIHAKSKALRVLALRSGFCHEAQTLFRVCTANWDRRGLGTHHRRGAGDRVRRWRGSLGRSDRQVGSTHSR